MGYAYIIESLKSGNWYYGSTEDLRERLKHHDNGWNRSTKGRGPWKFIFIRPFETIELAREFELHLKKLRRKSYIRAKYAEFFTEEIHPEKPRMGFNVNHSK